MRPVELNLATRPFRNDTPVAVVLGVLALAALAFTAYNAHAYLTADERESALRDELSDHRARMERLSAEAREIDEVLAAIDVATLESQASFVASVMQERNFSWTVLFNELERVVPWNVRLSSVRPTFTPGSIDLSILGTSKDVGAFFDFQETLEAAPHFANVLPTQWERQEGTPEISFTLSVVYRPQAAASGADADSEPAQAATAESAPGRPATAVDDEPARRLVIGEEPAGREAPAAAAPAASGPALSQPPGRRRAAPATGDTDRSAGDASRAAGSSAAGSAADADAGTEGSAGRVTNDYAGSTGAIRTRGAAAPDRGVRTETRTGETPRPNYDPNNPRNPPEIQYDAHGNPVAIVPRVSPTADRTRVPPTGRMPDLPEPEGGESGDPPAGDPPDGSGSSDSGDEGSSGDDGGSGGGA